MSATRLAAALTTALTLPLLAVDHHVTTAQEFQNALTTAAVNAADDTIYLAAGFYQGNFSFTSAEEHSLTVEAEPGLTRGEVTLDGAGVGGALNLVSSVVSNFVVRRLTISRNCGDQERDALRLATLGTMTITDLASLSASKAGRGIHVAAAASLTIEDCDISATGTAATGQGIFIEGVEGTITLDSNVVKGNRYVGTGSFAGSGIKIIGTSSNNVVLLSQNTIQNNLVQGNGSSYGGGLYIDGGSGTDSISLASNAIRGNQAGGGNNCIGGGVNIDAETLTLSGNQFVANGVLGNWPHGNGGGCIFNGNSANITDNSFVGNTAQNWYGSLALNCLTATVNGNQFRSNTCGQYGSALSWFAGTSSSITITDNQFYDNSGSNGGVVYCSGFEISITGNRFERNVSLGASGGAIAAGGAISVNFFLLQAQSLAKLR